MMFSVLSSVYKKESPANLRESLNSLLTQTLPPSEIILVEDGPLNAALYEVIEEFQSRCPLLKVVPLDVNRGLGNALNEGLKYCQYEIIARMDTDDIAKSRRFEKQMAIFEKFPDLDVVGSWIDEFEDSVSNVRSVRRLPELDIDIKEYAKKRCPINHPVVMFRKSAVLAVGGYRHFPLFEDYYLWVRMMMNGAKFYNIQESLLFFRFSPEVFKRRGGWTYAMDELRFQRFMRQMSFISYPEFARNILIRFFTRVIPNSWREVIYKKLLR